MSTVLEYNSEKQHFVLTCTIGIPHCFVSASYMRRLKEQELKVKISGKYVTNIEQKNRSVAHVFVSDMEHLDLLPNMEQRRKFQNIVLCSLLYL